MELEAKQAARLSREQARMQKTQRSLRQAVSTRILEDLSGSPTSRHARRMTVPAAAAREADESHDEEDEDEDDVEMERTITARASRASRRVADDIKYGVRSVGKTVGKAVKAPFGSASRRHQRLRKRRGSLKGFRAARGGAPSRGEAIALEAARRSSVTNVPLDVIQGIIGRDAGTMYRRDFEAAHRNIDSARMSARASASIAEDTEEEEEEEGDQSGKPAPSPSFFKDLVGTWSV